MPFSAQDTSTSDQSFLRIAVQKKGRLSEESLSLLKRCGLTLSQGKDRLYARAVELPIDVMFVRDDDIPAFVADGACDIGIVGQNVFEELALTKRNGGESDVVMPLGFSACRLAIGLPKASQWQGPQSLENLRIATSYPGITQRWLTKNNITAKTVLMNGAVELAPRLNIADAVCDIVSSGGTLDANGLKPVATIYESQAILIKSPMPLTQAKQSIFDQLLTRMTGVLQSRDAKYVMMNAPRSAIAPITKILPGSESPTVLTLASGDDMVAIHAVCRESIFWDTLEALKAQGASSILVLPIEKMMA